MMSMQIVGTPADPAVLDLPWSVPLEDWSGDQLVALPRGISRHTVRFVRIAGHVYAVKEINERLAQREYRLLRDLARLDAPCVEAVAVVTGRASAAGAPLDSALITRHLQFSLPYRAVFSGTLRPDTLTRLIDALAVLLVRLHLAGFYWGDCSLSNTLFRRDAGEFAAYLVDAETGELHAAASDGQRAHDIEIAHVNIYGELLDLDAGDLLHHAIDPEEVAERICLRYQALWDSLTEPEVFDVVEWHRVDARIRRLNALGFDVAEMQIRRKPGVEQVLVRPKVVDAGHHQRRLLRLTGLDAEENQARRLLSDLDTFRATLRDSGQEADEEIAVHRWLTEVFQRTVRAVPPQMRYKLDSAQLFHEVLDHRWFLSESAGHDVGLETAISSYLETVLAVRPDEKTMLGNSL
jgi:tRNA A-37 threonylcarbamoyl transferase component Bud32